MSLPQIKIDTIHATMEKMMQSTPMEYIDESLSDMVEDGNEELASCLAYIGKTMIDELPKLEGMDSDMIATYSTQTMMAYASLVYRVMKSQIEANELEEVWGK